MTQPSFDASSNNIRRARRNDAAARLLTLEQPKTAAVTPTAPVSNAPAAPAPVSTPPAAAQPPEPVRTSAITRGIHLNTYTGTQISSSAMPSAAECRDSCIKDKRCNAWSYYSASYVTVSSLPNDMFRKKCTLYDKGDLTKGGTSSDISSGVINSGKPTLTGTR